MKVRIISAGVYDRYDNEVRFLATIDNVDVSVSITTHALARIADALGMTSSDPSAIYAASGKFLNLIVEEAVKARGELQDTYLLTDGDVLRVTGSEPGLPHVPRRWPAT